jgi:arylsulfatase A-like enzyme
MTNPDSRPKPSFFIHGILICLVLLICPTKKLSAQTSISRPNIVWLVSEDNSQHWLQLYQKKGVSMPNVEALAQQGLVFNHAFSNAPVCSVARSTLISGSYAPRIGAQYHRRAELVPMPDGLKMFPYYLRQAGYYTSNNAKEDYNEIKSEGTWDESSGKATYRNRKEGQPFFHVQNFGITHEGQLHFTTEEMRTQQTETDPAGITPFPYHPNSETFRYTYARYREQHKKLDQQLGEFIQQLKEDGVMDNTIIFYYGDHGGVLPGSKGYLNESGLHVPLVVYVPEKWRQLVPAGPGSRIDGFVQFIDFGPTVLNLAGVEVPAAMDGKPFLGENIQLAELNSRQTAFSYADRFDEKYDLVRAVRRGKYKYIRYYEPFHSDGLYNFYRYRQLAYQDWKSRYQQGKLNAVQSRFFEPHPVEALYDLEADPYETQNLAGETAMQSVLLELRVLLQTQLKSQPDLSFYPEPYFLANGKGNPVQFGQSRKAEIAGLIDLADLSLVPFGKAKKELRKALKSNNPWERYWALIVCSGFGTEAKPFYKVAKKLAEQDTENLVRVRAAEFLALSGQMDPSSVLIAAFKNAASPTEANLILNTFAFLKESKGINIKLPAEAVKPELLTMNAGLVGRRLQYLIEGQRPRLLILTDIGGDPDDTQSMIRLLMHSEKFDLEGLIASASGTPGELKEAITRPDLIRELVDAYGKVEGKLSTHSPYFPEAAALQNLIKSGNPQRGWDKVGEGRDTEGSEWIIQVADRRDTRPLNIAIWGGQTDLAQALWKVKNTRSEAEYRNFVSKLRIYDIADQDGIFQQMWEEFPGLWYILNKAPEGQDKRNAVFRGMYLGGREELTSLDWLKENVIEDHGPLGALYPQKTWTAPNPYGAMKEGDTPSWFYFLDNGSQIVEHPEYGGWGGRFKMEQNGLYRDAHDQIDTVTNARTTVWRWRPDFQSELAARMDWGVKSYAEANHAPEWRLKPGQTEKYSVLNAKAGASLQIVAPAYFEPDGDPVSHHWFFYPEAGDYKGKLPEIRMEKDAAFLVVPKDAAGRQIQLVLQVSDQGTPALSVYYRYIIQVEN